MIKKMNHIGIAVKDLEASIAKWRGVFGLELHGVEAIEERGIRLAQLDMDNSHGVSIELISALGDDSPVSKYIEERGEGIHHFCFEVENIQKVISEMKMAGIRFMQEEPQKGAEGSLIAFIHPSNINGVLIELKQASS